MTTLAFVVTWRDRLARVVPVRMHQRYSQSWWWTGTGPAARLEWAHDVYVERWWEWRGRRWGWTYQALKDAS